MPLSQERLRAVLVWVVIILLLGPVGAALWLGFTHGDSPCILCWAQRTSILFTCGETRTVKRSLSVGNGIGPLT